MKLYNNDTLIKIINHDILNTLDFNSYVIIFDFYVQEINFL